MNVSGLSGNLVATPELRVTPSKIPVCSFTIAVKRPKTKDKTDFIDCVAWRQTAEFIVRNFQKGSAIEVSGPITSRTYEDKNGNKRKAVEILVDNVSFSGHKKTEKETTPKKCEECEHFERDKRYSFGYCQIMDGRKVECDDRCSYDDTETPDYSKVPVEDFREIPEEDLPF